jgi:hypothetical protein
MNHKFCFYAFFITISLLSSSLWAVDVSVGASAWYVSWERITQAGNGKSEINQKMGPEFMYGPILAFKFTNTWSLSSVLLYNSSPFIAQNQLNGETKYHRTDWDSLLNYNFNRFIKAFAGIKYEDISWSNNETGGTGGNVGAGPGLGIGATIPIAGNFYFLTNVSGMYLLGRYNNQGNRGDMKRYGYNLTANLAYYVEQISLTVTGGFRYQFYVSAFTNNQNSNENTFYGPTLSVIYTF